MTKADHIHRAIAKVIDFLIVGVLSNISWVGVLAAALYLAISDGFFSGQSVGKKLLGLRVVIHDPPGSAPRPCDFRGSIVRNFMISVVIVLSFIPIIGWFLFLPAGILFLATEAYFIYFDDRGIRIGDILAGTQVVDYDSKR